MLKSSRIFAIVVGFRSQQFLGACFTALTTQTRPPDGIIFVNNLPEDGCSEWVHRHFPSIHVLDAPRNLGYAGGNNFGIRYALACQADVVFILNPDVVLAPNCLETIENHMAGEIGFAQPVLEYPDGELQSAGNLVHYLGFCCSGHLLGNTHHGRRRVSYCAGAALWLDARALAASGLFEESLFLYHEDLELCLRGWLTGIPSWCVADAKAVHYHSRTGRFGKKFAWMEGNRWFVWLAYLGTGGMAALSPFLLCAELAVCLQAFRQHWLIDKIQAMIHLPSRLSDVRKLRRKLLRLHPSPGTAILPLLADHLDFPQPESMIEACANAVSRFLFPVAKRLLQFASKATPKR